eukprot:TRINITY_DN14924_c0_g1_i3.p1 TRINITY_DN14924_c0_g1~~TRINITY_DN14924_c0_g1_i3.p1  ORF type:complete len:415 (+),score=133.19 TRINITY_DN14924_c0_g1_i3:142-1386(+)
MCIRDRSTQSTGRGAVAMPSRFLDDEDYEAINTEWDVENAETVADANIEDPEERERMARYFEKRRLLAASRGDGVAAGDEIGTVGLQAGAQGSDRAAQTAPTPAAVAHQAPTGAANMPVPKQSAPTAAQLIEQTAAEREAAARAAEEDAAAKRSIVNREVANAQALEAERARRAEQETLAADMMEDDIDADPSNAGLNRPASYDSHNSSTFYTGRDMKDKMWVGKDPATHTATTPGSCAVEQEPAPAPAPQSLSAEEAYKRGLQEQQGNAPTEQESSSGGWSAKRQAEEDAAHRQAEEDAAHVRTTPPRTAVDTETVLAEAEREREAMLEASREKYEAKIDSDPKMKHESRKLNAKGYLEEPETRAQERPRVGSALSAEDAYKAVSYTHLRAHETPEHLVCRLLLEKKKKKKNK